jgi:predicted Zn finger-like uncharacterized protein
MKTRCPNCQTVFRVTSEQLATRAGKVRCGHCQKVFNAVDELLEKPSVPADALSPMPGAAVDACVASESAPDDGDGDDHTRAEIPGKIELPHPSWTAEPEAAESEKIYPYDTPLDPVVPDANPAAELIFPRETSEIPGYSKWAEGGMAPPLAIAAEKPLYWPFRLAAVILLLAFVGQTVFHFRGELAIFMPSLRPALEAFSLAVDGPLPLPRNAELIGIETSELQADMTRDRLLVLNTTLRNKAPYGQAYPSLELSLTDMQDTVIARRIFSPQDYLPEKAVDHPFFPANSDLAVRLWIEVADLGATGYRLFVYYP